MIIMVTDTAVHLIKENEDKQNTNSSCKWEVKFVL